MISGTEHGISKANIVLHAAQDLDFSIGVKRERMMAGVGRGYRVLGCIETIVFERDKGADMDDLNLQRRGKTRGRYLYWPENCPLIAETIPEGDLIFTKHLTLPLPKVPGTNLDVIENPYGVDQAGFSLWKPGDALKEPPKVAQPLEKIASGKFKNFLVFHPVAQIIMLMNAGGKMRFGSVGDVRAPISSLTGFDGRKMALIIDPYTGEAYFTGGRYQMSLKG